MARVVPSQIVSLIDRHPPVAVSSSTANVTHMSAAILGAVVRLVDNLPDELLTISGDDYGDLVCGVEGIRNSIAFWQNAAGARAGIGIAEIRGKHPLILIRDALAKCPDQAPSRATTELAFVADPDLRESIRLDISSAAAALHNGDWKAATVLAGAASEALLLWSIGRHPNLANIAKRPKKSPEWWNFEDYIDVATSLDLIEKATAQQATLAKDFRNLIHPGRAQRQSEVCDRGTALTALAAVELIARDLTSRDMNAT